MNEDMMTEAERASIAADGTDGLLGKRGKGVFHIHTLGCQMNVHDSERIAGVLEANGYVPATEDQINDNDLDLLVLNTCAVRENAAERMYGTIGRFNRVKLVRPNLQIAVGGCMAQLDRKKIADTAPWVSAVFGTKNIEDLPKLLDQNRATGKAQVQVTEQLRQFPSQLPAARASRISSWVAISVGCNNTCTFCIVPTTRGKEKDRRPGDILDEIRQCVADGAKEVTLLGQNVNSFGYGIGDRYAFSKLLRACGTIDGLDACASPRRTRPPSPTTSSPRWPKRRTSCTSCTSRCSPAPTASCARCAAPTAPPSSSTYWAASAPPCPTRRSPPTSSSLPRRNRRGLPADHGRGAPGALLLGVHVHLLATPRHAAAAMEQIPRDVVQDRFDRLVALQEQITEENLATFEGRDVEV